MYQFKIVKLDDGGYRFELGAIKIYTDGFSIKDGKHLFNTPTKAIGYFNIDGNLYGVSNDLQNANSAEDFYDSMTTQYLVFAKGSFNNLRQSA
ncbi:MAG: hypothetical protein K0Q79_546 [Flavipsychrobacter sp.]|jgi:hypothetical protein|nr:hypothetical protein [Flavipsychrobacter sp.]